MICDATKDDMLLSNLERKADHAEIDVTCLKCGWQERVNLSLDGGTPQNIYWMHATPEKSSTSIENLS